MQSGASAPATAQQSNEQLIDSYLVNVLHFSQAEAAGILGNFQIESGFSTSANNPAEGAIGLAQWEGGRRTALDQYAAAHHLGETDLAAQLGYLTQELNGPYKAVADAIRHTQDPATAARLFDIGPGGTNSGTGFENSSGAADAQRQSAAQSIYAQILGHQPLTGGGTSAPGAGAASGANSIWNIPGTGFIPNPSLLGPLGSIPGVGDLFGNVGSAVAKDVGNAILDVIKQVTAPFTKYLLDAFLIIVGAVMIIMSLRMLSDVDTNGGEYAGGSNERETGPALGSGHDEHDDAGGSSSSGGGGGLGSAVSGMGGEAKAGARDVEAALS